MRLELHHVMLHSLVTSCRRRHGLLLKMMAFCFFKKEVIASCNLEVMGMVD